MTRILDMHCDTIAELYYARRSGEQQGLLHNMLHIDLTRMKAAGYLLQTFAMFVNLETHTEPYEYCMELIDLFDAQMMENAGLIGQVRTTEEIFANDASGRMSALLSIEEGGVCQGDLNKLREFYRRGVRMMTLTWNFENDLGFPNTVVEGGSAYLGSVDTGRGLKEAGFLFLEEMERLGIIVDVSHLSDAGFYDVLHAAKRPFIASHSNARAICGHVRNLTDDMIRKLSETGGITGINLCASFTEEAGTEEQSYGTIEGLIRHIRHIRDIGGIECIGLGTDYDGIGQRIELLDCSHMPRLADGMKKAGFHESEIDAVFYKNALRLMKDILDK